MLDDVHVTILAYGSDLKNGLIPGHPVHRYFRCGDLIIVGLSAGIMFSIAALIITLIVMLVMSYIHRRKIKSYVVDAVWPQLQKPTLVFSNTNRDDHDYDHWDTTEKSELLQQYEEGDELPAVMAITAKLISDKKIAPQSQNTSGFDSGISEYSGASASSSKSLPIYRLGYRIDFRRTSNASSGISSQHSASNSGKSGIQSIHTVSSNHSGDSVLSKGGMGSDLDQPWSKHYNFTLSPKNILSDNYVASVPISDPLKSIPLAQYSVMGDSFNEGTLRTRSPQFTSNTENGYIGHGYVENSIFNLTNMPTVFLENFKKIQKMQEINSRLDTDNYIIDNFDKHFDYGGYKPISALMPNQHFNHLPPGYTSSNIFADPPSFRQPTESKLDEPLFDDYVTDSQFVPQAATFASQQVMLLLGDKVMRMLTHDLGGVSSIRPGNENFWNRRDLRG